MNRLPIINAFWVGPRLGPVHAACLQSFVRQGHRTILHCYEKPEDAPKGVEIADAALVLPADRLVRHRKSGSLALSSDLFRMELQAIGGGIYVDADCYCVRPLEDDEYIFGWESSRYIASGVLRLPAESAILEAMRAIATTRGFIPPWERPELRLFYRLCRTVGMPVPLERMRWGSMGPKALTHYVREFGLTGHARPIDVFYPVHFDLAGLLRDPGLRLADLITARTRTIHVWNELQRKIDAPPPPGSPLDEIIASLEP